MAYHRYHGLNTRIVRIFNTFGPRMRMSDGRVVPNFITQALRGEGLTVYGQGTQTRSFLYIDDLVAGLHRLIEADYHLPVNLGNPYEMTVMDFAKKILELTGSSSPIVYEPLPQDDPQVRQPDIARAREILGWEPRVEVDEGLRRTIRYFKEKLGKQAQ
jgi:dTDP-glucose 4,6-dehydratase